MTPSNKQVQALFDRLGNTIPVDDFNLTMKMGVVSCVMGDFYQHQQAVFEWLTEAGISKEAATQGVASFVNTFNFASLQAEGQGKAGFAHLVAEQTPGGMNEQVGGWQAAYPPLCRYSLAPKCVL
jgi:pyrroline-5-carboxylate reductase